jgi:hypothetical protein
MRRATGSRWGRIHRHTSRWIAAAFGLRAAHAQAPPFVSAPSVEQQLTELERKNRALAEEVARLKADEDFTKSRVEQVMPLVTKVTGYVDFGFYAVAGNGSGARLDVGHARFPEYATGTPDTTAVFMGDPLSTAVNARGEPADVAAPPADGPYPTFNAIRNGGSPSFIANSLNLSLLTTVGDDLAVHASVDFVPRSRDVSDPNGFFLGDFLDVKTAYAEYAVVRKTFYISAGKLKSLLGREYRTQEAPDRTTATPSLICRYTCGYPLGVEARVELFSGAVNIAAAVTNGSSFVEALPFQNEVAVTAAKTASSRWSYKLGVDPGIEVGVSGAYGAQDVLNAGNATQWHAGADVHFGWRGIDLDAEYVSGNAEGKTGAGETPCGEASCIRYRGAYALLGVRVAPWLEPFARWDWQDALQRLHDVQTDFVYIANLTRATGGARLDLGPNVIAKAEYTFNGELGRIPRIKNDVFTSSVVFRY